MGRPTIICPVDFSEPSRAALRFAATIATHFYAGLTVVTVEDPLLSAAGGAVYGAGTYENRSREELWQFVGDTFQHRTPTLAGIRLEVATGEPAREILRVANAQNADLIILSTHGRTGARKAFFGSTTERLLRDTPVPVLVTPSGDPGPADLEQLARGIGGILAPLDLTQFSKRQLAVASGLARALTAPLTLLHVVEPLMALTDREAIARRMQAERKREAAKELQALAAAVDTASTVTVSVAEGDAAAEIVDAAAASGLGVIVMGLHDTSALGPRIGSVTYRVLCQTKSAVLALPPWTDSADHKPEVFARASHRLHARSLAMSLPEGR